jgi:hypothetical protein
MNKRSLGALVALNIVLLVALALVSFSPQPAKAQVGLRQSEYIMVSGVVRGRTQQAVVYIIDLSTGQMAAIFHNADTGKSSIIAGRNMAADAK